MFCPVLACSIRLNNIGAQGAAAVAKALETNSSLRELEYAASHLVLLSPADNTLSSLSLPSHSVGDNQLGPAGVKPIAEMLKVNKSIVNIK